MLPQTVHPTTLSVLEIENATVLNVLVDMVIDHNHFVVWLWLLVFDVS